MSLALGIAIGVGTAVALTYALIVLAFRAFGRPLSKQ
jgi:hypothetical protein